MMRSVPFAMLLALLPLLLPAAHALLPQSDLPSATQTYAGPHCSFPFQGDVEVKEYGTGWGVVSELLSTKSSDANQQPLLRVTSIFSSADANGLAGQLLGLDREEIAAHAWVMSAEGTPVTRLIDGAERNGVRHELSRDVGTATYTLFAWAHEGSVNMVRTIAQHQEHQAIIDACINGLTLSGIQADTQRNIGIEEYGFKIPANWESSSQHLNGGAELFTISFPSGTMEILMTGPGNKAALMEFRDQALRDATSRFISASVNDQGVYLGKRRGWLNVEGEIVQGRIHQWKNLNDNVFDFPVFTFIPEGLNRVVQLQLSPNPEAYADLLSEVTRTTRNDVYRKENRSALQDSVEFDGFTIPLPNGMQRVDLLSDTFAGGKGVALGEADDGGPRWFFWNIPHAIDQAELPELQAAWLQQWLDRDLVGGEVLLRQTIDVDIHLAGTYQGLAWTVKHSQVNRADNRDWISTKTRDWMCVAVAIPYGEQTLLAILQVDDRDKFPMFDDFRFALKHSATLSALGFEAEGFAMTIPNKGPWAILNHPGEIEEEYVFLHPYGRVRAALHHFTADELAGSVSADWISRTALRTQTTKAKADGGTLGNISSYGFAQLGQRVVPRHSFGYATSDGRLRSMQFSHWVEGNTLVQWSVESASHHASFKPDVDELIPAGGAPTDFFSSSQSYQGLQLPNPSPFQWVGMGGFITQRLSLQFNEISKCGVTLEFLPDPGETHSDQDLLEALLPPAPEWNPIGALRAIPIETKIFGRITPGLRRTGLPMDGIPIMQEVYIDRNQGTLSILRVDGPQDLEEAAAPVLKKLFAAIRPEETIYVMNPSLVSEEDRAKLAIQEVDPLTLALPKGFTVEKGSENALGETWSHYLGMNIGVYPFADSQSLSGFMTDLVSSAKSNPRVPELGEEAPMVPYSFIAIVDGRTCPGAALDMGGAPTFLVAVTQKKTNYLVSASAWTEEGAKKLLCEALTTVKLESPIFTPAW